MPWVPLIAAVVSVAASAASAATQAKAARQQAKAQTKTAEYNAQVARNNAIIAQQSSDYEAKKIRRRNLLVLGRQRALAGKSNVALGSFEDLLADSEVQGEMDALASTYKGAIIAGGYRSQAGLYTYAAKNAQQQGQLAFAGSILGGVGDVTSSISTNPQFQ